MAALTPSRAEHSRAQHSKAKADQSEQLSAKVELLPARYPYSPCPTHPTHPPLPTFVHQDQAHPSPTSTPNRPGNNTNSHHPARSLARPPTHPIPGLVLSCPTHGRSTKRPGPPASSSTRQPAHPWPRRPDLCFYLHLSPSCPVLSTSSSSHDDVGEAFTSKGHLPAFRMSILPSPTRPRAY